MTLDIHGCLAKKNTLALPRLVIGTGAYSRLPVMPKVQRKAKGHRVKLLILPTLKTIEVLEQDSDDTNAILHVTC